MSNDRKDLERANRAKALLNDDLIVEAFEMIEQNCLSDFKNSKASQKDDREDIWKMLKALHELKRHLTSVMERGKLAEHNLSLAEKIKRKVNL